MNFNYFSKHYNIVKVPTYNKYKIKLFHSINKFVKYNYNKINYTYKQLTTAYYY